MRDLDFCWDTKKDVTVLAGGDGIMVCGMCTWNTLGPLIPISHGLSAMPIWLLFLTICIPLWPHLSSSNGYFQHDNLACHKAKVVSNWFHEHENEIRELRCHPRAPTVTRSESTRTLAAWMCSQQICRYNLMQSCQHGTEFWKIFSNILWIPCI